MALVSGKSRQVDVCFVRYRPTVGFYILWVCGKNAIEALVRISNPHQVRSRKGVEPNSPSCWSEHDRCLMRTRSVLEQGQRYDLPIEEPIVVSVHCSSRSSPSSVCVQV